MKKSPIIRFWTHLYIMPLRLQRSYLHLLLPLLRILHKHKKLIPQMYTWIRLPFVLLTIHPLLLLPNTVIRNTLWRRLHLSCWHECNTIKSMNAGGSPLASRPASLLPTTPATFLPWAPILLLTPIYLSFWNEEADGGMVGRTGWMGD